MNLGCVVMAAGSSSRFGANKLLAAFRGKPLIRWTLEAVPKNVFARVVVVTGYEPVARWAQEQGFAVCRNNQPELGISRTIRLGLEQLTDCGGVLFMTADQPFLSTGTVENLAADFQKHPQAIVAAGHQGKKGNPCLFPKALYPELLALSGDCGGSRVIRAHSSLLRLVETPARELADCDTEQALQQLGPNQLTDPKK